MRELIAESWAHGFAIHFFLAVCSFGLCCLFAGKADKHKEEDNKTLAMLFAALHGIFWMAIWVLLFIGVTNTVLWPMIKNLVKSFF